jgi:hypothetical protein
MCQPSPAKQSSIPIDQDDARCDGYEEFLAALADPDNSEHEDLEAWIGGAFDPAAFDLAEVDESLNPSEF